MKRALTWAAIALAAPVVTLAGTPQATLREVPFPALEGLERAVATQIAEIRAGLSTAIEGPRSQGSELGLAFGDLGRVYHAYGFSDAAIACYANARLLLPGDYRWPYYLATLRRIDGALDAAADDYETALALRADYVPALIALGELQAERNDGVEAERILLSALEIAPGSAAAMAALGDVSLSRQDFDEAARRFEMALAWAPDASRLHYPLALAYRGLGDRVAAERHLSLRGSVGVRPADPLLDDIVALQRGETVHLLRGRRAFGAGRFGDAAQAFRLAAEAAPQSARARVNLGSALAALGDNRGAVAEFEAALALEPDNATAHFNLGSLLMLADGSERAGEHLAASVRLEPDDTEALLALARFRAERGGGNEVIELLERAVAVDTDGRATQALSRYLSSCAVSCERDGGRALELAIADYQVARSGFHAETVALALATLGRCSEAVRWQRTALQAPSPNDSVATLEAREAVLARYATGPPCASPDLASWQ